MPYARCNIFISCNIDTILAIHYRNTLVIKASRNNWVDMLWLTLAAKMLNTNLRIYSPRWKTSGSSTKCIDPIKPIDVCDVPLSSSVGGPTLKVTRVTSANSTCAHYNLLLDAEEASSIHYTYGASPDGETDDTRFIMFRKGDEVQPALKTAMKAKMAEELDDS